MFILHNTGNFVGELREIFPSLSHKKEILRFCKLVQPYFQ